MEIKDSDELLIFCKNIRPYNFGYVYNYRYEYLTHDFFDHLLEKYKTKCPITSCITFYEIKQATIVAYIKFMSKYKEFNICNKIIKSINIDNLYEKKVLNTNLIKTLKNLKKFISLYKQYIYVLINCIHIINENKDKINTEKKDVLDEFIKTIKLIIINQYVSISWYKFTYIICNFYNKYDSINIITTAEFNDQLLFIKTNYCKPDTYYSQDLFCEYIGFITGSNNIDLSDESKIYEKNEIYGFFFNIYNKLFNNIIRAY